MIEGVMILPRPRTIESRSGGADRWFEALRDPLGALAETAHKSLDRSFVSR